jgi:hypothetical protein
MAESRGASVATSTIEEAAVLAVFIERAARMQVAQSIDADVLANAISGIPARWLSDPFEGFEALCSPVRRIGAR